MIKLEEYLKNKKTYIIAEMSGNHGGDFNKCKEIIDAAAHAGADCLKIQTYTKDTLTIDCNRDEFIIKGGLWNKENLYSLYTKAYTPWEWTKDIKKLAEEKGMDFLSTPFDFTAVDFLEELGIGFYKIASMEIVDLPLIKKVAQTGKPLLLSCGMASEEEIKEAVSIFKKYSKAQLVLLKCCSAYPTKYEDLNLDTIPDMIKKFGTYVGLSDHSGGTLPDIVAVTKGACVIEKHFCISKNDKTVDSDFSLDKDEFKQLVEDIRNTEKALGQPNYGPSNDEKQSYNLRRSLYVVKDIKKGERFSSENIRSIRPSNGLHTKYYEFLINNGTASCDIKFGTPLNESMINEKLEIII